MCCSSFICVGPRLGEEGHWVEDCPEAKGDEAACQPWTFRISAEV